MSSTYLRDSRTLRENAIYPYLNLGRASTFAGGHPDAALHPMGR
jgi:hypothetical protein